MAKFSGTSVAPAATSPVTTQPTPTTSTFEGASAYLRDARSELFLLAVTNMVGEDTFYEASSSRDIRFRDLVHQLATSDSVWLYTFITWLRKTANMRSAPIVAAAEYIKAGGPNGRALVANTLHRADEPAEILGYWLSRYGRQFPQPLKRGVADAVVKLYNEYSVLKYDGQSRAIRMGDVIELTHPKPKDNRQSHLFTWLLDRRHQGTAKADGRILKVIKNREGLETIPVESRRDLLRDLVGQGDMSGLSDAGATWEWLSGWLPGGMDAEAWEAVIPQMGYMALLRNLRNFDEAKISTPTRNRIIEKLADRDEVARSRQFPFRFWSAFKNTKTLHWAPALETALELSVSNIPALPGRTLILTDTSGSMQMSISERSTVRHFEIAALFAAAVGSRVIESEVVDLVSFAATASPIPFTPGDSVLRTMQAVDRHNGKDGHATNLARGLEHYRGHDRIVVFSDMQVMRSWGGRGVHFPEGVPTYIFNTSGYQASPVETGTGHVHEIGGFSDAAFRLIPLIEAGKRADWPWEIDWSSTP